MLAIVISEKGGAERREIFDKHEINVGRVQGNDLMLPKGNVSKRHARLLFRDGRVIVTDLKSTNGTYVNGRKIAQATIVREGDKIYVGDFVLRVELTASTPSPRASGGTASPSASMPAAVPQPRPSASLDREFTSRHDFAAAGTTSDASDSATGKHPQPEMFDAAASSAARPSAPFFGDGPMSPRHPPSPSPPSPSPSYTSPPSAPAPLPPPVARPSPAVPAPSLIARVPANQPNAPRRVSSRLAALTLLVERVAEGIDLTPLSRGAEPDQVLSHRIERLIRDKAKALREEGQLPAAVDVDDAVRDAQRELLGLGAIEALLDEDDVSEIRVFGHSSVTAIRGGQIVDVDPPFSSEGALFRAIVRLCRQAATPLGSGETIIERYLPRGLLIQAVLPPVSQNGHALVVRKRKRAEVGLDDLVRSGTVSRAMATFLRSCAAARANLLVVGPPDGTPLLLAALATAGHAADRVVALQAIDELWGLEPAPISIRLPDTSDEAMRVVRAAAKLRPDRLVISPLAGPAAAAVLGAIAEGCEGVLAAVSAPSLRHALDRLVADLMAARPGLTGEAAKRWLLGSFELAVEIARLRDGRFRVMRVAELEESDPGVSGRDVFTFVVERTAVGGAVEGSFVATGIVPRIADEMAARGGPLDSAVFRR